MQGHQTRKTKSPCQWAVRWNSVERPPDITAFRSCLPILLSLKGESSTSKKSDSFFFISTLDLLGRGCDFFTSENKEKTAFPLFKIWFSFQSPCINYRVPGKRMSNIRNPSEANTSIIQTSNGLQDRWEGKEYCIGSWERSMLSFLTYKISSKLPQWKLTISDLILLELCGFNAEFHSIQKNQVIKCPSDLDTIGHCFLRLPGHWIKQKHFP